MALDILPCPFCGGTDLRLGRHQLDSTAWFITCWNCESNGPVVQASEYESNEEPNVMARDAWNKRPVQS